MAGSRIRVLLAGILALSVALGTLPFQAGPARAEDSSVSGLAPDFDWSMPDRTGLDRDGDGVVDAMTTRAQISPPSWTVDFDACASRPKGIASYHWSIEGQEVAPDAAETTSCRGFSHAFPAEGVYPVTLTVRDGGGHEKSLTRDVVVQDFLIVAIGDSYGSGQGNPDRPISSALLDAANSAFNHLNAALSRLSQLQHAYDDTAAKVAAAEDRLRALQDALWDAIAVCDPFSTAFSVDACAQAPGDLAAALARLQRAIEDLGDAVARDTEVAMGTIAMAIGTLSADLLDDAAAVLTDVFTRVQDAAWAALRGQRDLVTAAQEAFDDALADLTPTWQDKRCNRSSISGQAQAAKALEDADPHTSVTLVHLSCSGATISEGLIGPYAGVEPPAGASDLPPQVVRAAALIGGREVDAVLVSIGGNDVGFGPMITACMLVADCTKLTSSLDPGISGELGLMCATQVAASLGGDCARGFESLVRAYRDTVRTAKAIFEEKSPSLPDRYNALAGALAEVLPAVAGDPARVLISEYPNAVEDEDGRACDADTHGLARMLPGVTAAESAWFRNTVTLGLNGMIQEAATAHGWTKVGGIYDAFSKHGYCARDSWIRRLQDSFAMQGTKEGTAHPTPPGHRIYRDQYLDALMAQLYGSDSGDGLGLPRLPVAGYAPALDTAPPVVTGVPARKPNANGWYRSPVTIDWVATDPEPSSGTPSDPPDTLAATEGADVRYTSEPSCDPAGRCARGTVRISLDMTPPTLACPAPAPAFRLGEAGASLAAEVSDPLSGPDDETVSAPVDTARVGTGSVRLVGRDRAGNTAEVSCGYRVEYAFSGLYPWVWGRGPLNVMRAGLAIPFAWRLADASGRPYTGLRAASLTVREQDLDCATGAPLGPARAAPRTQAVFASLGLGFYAYAWRSPASYAGSCKAILIGLGDGADHAALFRFTR